MRICFFSICFEMFFVRFVKTFPQNSREFEIEADNFMIDQIKNVFDIILFT